MIIDEGRWIELKRKGNNFKIKHAPNGEQLRILVKVNWFDEDYWTVVSYGIVDEQDLTAQNREHGLIGINP